MVWNLGPFSAWHIVLDLFDWGSKRGIVVCSLIRLVAFFDDEARNAVFGNKQGISQFGSVVWHWQ